MAPEILAHEPYEGRLTDTWSAGVVIFIMITGNPPFQLATRSDWWFNALATGNVERFWRAHMRSAPNISVEVSDSFRNSIGAYERESDSHVQH